MGIDGVSGNLKSNIRKFQMGSCEFQRRYRGVLRGFGGLQERCMGFLGVPVGLRGIPGGFQRHFRNFEGSLMV